MILRRGRVVAEGWWAPYRPDDVHLLYSISKSFTSTALGFALAEGRLALDDTVVQHFPDLDPGPSAPRARAITVEHLARMATGHHADILDTMVGLDPAEPVSGFLQIEPDPHPGSVFAYNNGATYVLAAIVQERTGQSLTDYLQPRLFDPLGIARRIGTPSRPAADGLLRTAPENRGAGPVRAALPGPGQLGRVGAALPRLGGRGNPSSYGQPRRAGAGLATKATATSSGGPGTATEVTARTASSAWSCPSRMRWWSPPRRRRPCRPSSMRYGPIWCRRSTSLRRPATTTGWRPASPPWPCRTRAREPTLATTE